MDKLTTMEMQIDCLDNMFRKNLERRMESLIKTLQVELEQLKKNPNYQPNSCGIVQGEGLTIDELCVKIGTLKMVKQ